MAKVIQFPTATKVEYSDGVYRVMIWSPVIGSYICQGEWPTEAEAKMDARNWM